MFHHLGARFPQGISNQRRLKSRVSRLPRAIGFSANLGRSTGTVSGNCHTTASGAARGRPDFRKRPADPGSRFAKEQHPPGSLRCPVLPHRVREADRGCVRQQELPLQVNCRAASRQPQICGLRQSALNVMNRGSANRSCLAHASGGGVCSRRIARLGQLAVVAAPSLTLQSRLPSAA